MTDKKCEVKGCPGVYKKYILGYHNFKKIKTPDYNISPEKYNQLMDKTGYHAIFSIKCSVCNDDLDFRLAEFYRQLKV